MRIRQNVTLSIVYDDLFTMHLITYSCHSFVACEITLVTPQTLLTSKSAKQVNCSSTGVEIYDDFKQFISSRFLAHAYNNT